MKKSIYIGAALCGMLLTTSCEKDLPVFSSEESWINFTEYEEEEVTYSFVYNNDLEIDTVWLAVSTHGFLSEQDRSFKLKQTETGSNDAVAGTHYVSFDDAELCANYYYMPAGQVECEVPVVVLRDASLKSTEVTLQVEFEENENFKLGYESESVRTVYISDQLIKPAAWDTYSLAYYTAIYTKGVHQFFIDVTGEKWDDEYIESIGSDFSYLMYLNGFFTQKLEEVNAERQAQGLDVLREEDGTPVVIKTRSMWG